MQISNNMKDKRKYFGSRSKQSRKSGFLEAWEEGGREAC